MYKRQEHNYTLRGESAHYHRVNGADVLHRVRPAGNRPKVEGYDPFPLCKKHLGISKISSSLFRDFFYQRVFFSILVSPKVKIGPG